MKDMTSVATTMMTDEEKAEIEKQMNSPQMTSPPMTPSVTTDAHRPAAAASTGEQTPVVSVPPAATTNAPTATPAAAPAADSAAAASSTDIVAHGTTPPATDATSTYPPKPNAPLVMTAAEKEAAKREAAARKAEQREKLREHERARRKVMEERVAMLTKKMVERLRPFVEAKHPGGKDDPETLAFEERMKREVEDLKLESFGIEVCRHFHLSCVWFVDKCYTASTYNWICVHDEGHVVHEVAEVLGNVSYNSS
jgi:hypothetical protein